MKSRTTSLHKRFGLELRATAAVLMLLAFLFLPTLAGINCFVLEPQKVGPGRFILKSSTSIPAGNYYLSTGRPKGSCSVFQDDKLIASNKSLISETRDVLGLGTPITFKALQPLSLEIRCQEEKGFQPQLTYAPIIAGELQGKFVQFLRLLFQVCLAPGITALLFLGIVIGKIAERKYSTRILFSADLITLSVISFLYSLSLSHITRFFLSADTATSLHIFLRTCLVLSFLCSATKISNKKYISFYIIGAWLCVLISSIGNMDRMTNLYKEGFVLYILATLEVYSRNRMKFFDSSQKRLLAAFAFSWSIIQVVDAIFSFNFQTGENLSLALCLVVPAYLVIIIRLGLKKWHYSNELSSLLTRLLAEEGKISDRAVSLGRWLNDYFAADYASFYVDKFLLGIELVPNQHFRSVYSNRNLPNADFSVEATTLTEQNNWSSSAMRSRTALLGSNLADQSLFVCLPVGSSLLYNFSFKRNSNVSMETVAEGLRLLEGNSQVLNSFSQMVSSHSSFHYETLRTLRSKLGNTEQTGKVLSVFLDVNGYSRHIRRHGETFSNFIETRVFERLAHDLRSVATVELKMGDELHFAVLPWGQQSLSVEEASRATINYLIKFLSDVLPNMSREFGFEEVTMSGGIAFGEATLRVNDRYAGTSGQSVNLAKRLLQSADTEELVIDPSAYLLARDLLSEAKPKEIFIKSEHARAFSISFRAIHGIQYAESF